MHQKERQNEWFDTPRQGEPAPGLRFRCTMCGNCCTGPEGYVLVSDDEASALAARLGVTTQAFLDAYTRPTSAGRSLEAARGRSSIRKRNPWASGFMPAGTQRRRDGLRRCWMGGAGRSRAGPSTADAQQ